VDYDERVERFGETVLPFRDPDGLPVELVAVEIPDDDPTVPWTEFVSEASAIRGFHSVTLWLADPGPTTELLQTMGLEEVGTEQAQGDTPGDERTRFAASGPVGRYVDVLPDHRGRPPGTRHGPPRRLPDPHRRGPGVDAQSGPVGGPQPHQRIDRHWFRSVYFREHGGVLFELATNGPGYDSDEPLDDLGVDSSCPARSKPGARRSRPASPTT